MFNKHFIYRALGLVTSQVTALASISAAKLTDLAAFSEAQLTALGLLTEAEIQSIDGSSTSNNTASKLASLDANKALRTNANIGTPATGVTAVEYGDGYDHVTVLTLTDVSLGTSGDNVDKATGALLYTLPAGAAFIKCARADVGVMATDAVHQAQTDIEFGLGTVIASGAVSVLGGTPTFENILIGDGALTDVNGTATEKVGMNTSGGLAILTAGAQTVHLNVAGTWDDADAASDLTADGQVVLHWTYLA